jgi:hypothetical protein
VQPDLEHGVVRAMLPAIALTAFARQRGTHRARCAGLQAHIAKPVDPPELLATVASFSADRDRRRTVRRRASSGPTSPSSAPTTRPRAIGTHAGGSSAVSSAPTIARARRKSGSARIAPVGQVVQDEHRPVVDAEIGERAIRPPAQSFPVARTSVPEHARIAAVAEVADRRSREQPRPEHAAPAP